MRREIRAALTALLGRTAAWALDFPKLVTGSANPAQLVLGGRLAAPAPVLDSRPARLSRDSV